MPEDYGRQVAHYKNETRQTLGLLIGMANGLLADQALTDDEIHFLDDWVTANNEIASEWPTNIVHQRLKAVLADGVITEVERTHLVNTLRQLVGGTPEELARAKHVTELTFDEDAPIVFPGCTFCLTGDFAYAPRPVCEAAIVKRGGVVKSGVSKKLGCLVVGSLGSPEWKHGSFGTKIEKAMQLRSEGAGICVIKEDRWTAAL